MAPVEIDTIPYDIMAPVKNLKVVTKAFELPLVTSAYTEIATLASPLTPIVENTMTTITPIVEVGINTIKTTMEESVLPHLPEGMTETLQSNMTAAVEHVTAAVDKVDILACGGLEQLTDKVPALKDATPELIETTKVTATGYLTSATDYLASFSLAQVALKIVDTGLDVVEQALALVGSSDESLVSSGIKKIHTTANTIRISGNKKAGTDVAKKIEEASIVGAIIEVSGLGFILGMLGLKVTKTVYEDEHARVEVETEEESEPVVVDTNVVETEEEVEVVDTNVVETEEEVEVVDYHTFMGMVRDLLAWSSGLRRSLITKEKVSNAASAQMLLTEHDNLMAEMETREKTFSEVVALGEAMVAEEHSAMGEVKEKIDSVLTERQKLHTAWQHWQHCLADLLDQLSNSTEKEVAVVDMDEEEPEDE